MKNRFSLRTALAMALFVFAQPAFAVGGSCSFRAQGLSMGFGSLDPSTGATIVAPVAAATLNANMAGDCSAGQTMAITGFTGTRNLRNPAGDLIPYSLNGLPQSRSGPGNGNYVVFTFSGTIQGSAYANAPAGLYSDTVTISVTP